MKAPVLREIMSPLIWSLAVLLTLHALFVLPLSHRGSSETTLCASTEQVHDVCDEVLRTNHQDMLPQVVEGNKHGHAVLLRWACAGATTHLSRKTTLVTMSDRPARVTISHLFVHKFSPPDSDDDALRS